MKSRTAAMGRYKPLGFGSVNAWAPSLFATGLRANKTGNSEAFGTFPRMTAA